ncbi:hypothetical protein MA20_48245 [Bradyrhizobium japonicum]|uniref:Uncharacterized protein n=1 Tax=Bradyrhizobium japonicum TaxID=375 RepID=A0A0A3YGG1_BRAJP|nr:hypothetical protein MA20_48245 [Bradyrhizobium japonicum]
MKRVQFAAAEELRSFCKQAEVQLVLEYRDVNGKQRQVILQENDLDQVETYFTEPEVMAYYRKDGIFYEVVASWAQK